MVLCLMKGGGEWGWVDIKDYLVLTAHHGSGRGYYEKGRG
jgi:hypothetical protein